MKSKILVFIISVFAVACSSSGVNQKKDRNRIVTVSILPVKTFVEKIGGDDFEVNVLLPQGASPANFSLVPSQLKKIAESEIWFRIGHIGFELSSKDKIIDVNSDMKVVDLSEGLELIESESQFNNESEKASGVNPHIWLSTSLVQQMANQIFLELSALNPDRKEMYRQNYENFVQEIGILDKEIQSKLNAYQGRQFISFHPSFSYYAREYGLVQYSLEPGGKEPTPQRMAKLIDLARREDIRVIYIQSDFDIDQARVFAEETNGKIKPLWPLNPDWANNLRDITGKLVSGFREEQ